MKEKISALMDGELESDNSSHLFTALKSDAELSACWSSYHLIGDAMRGNPIFKPDFQQRLMQKLDLEPAVLAPKASKPLMRSPAIWSVAASVSAVMFVGWMVLQQQSGDAGNFAAQEVAQNFIPPAEYLMAHQQASATAGTSYYIQPAAYSESSR